MKVFFTADCHFDHANIIKYSNRPFKTVENMNNEIVKRWNNVVSPDDLIYHVGDFAFKGQSNASKFEKQLNGNIVHIAGNHDLNNGIKSYIIKAMMHFGGKEIFVQHHPPIDKNEIPICDFVVCGHVHEKWKAKFVKDCNIPIINVGVDVWNFEPVSTLSLLKYYRQLINKEALKRLIEHKKEKIIIDK